MLPVENLQLTGRNKLHVKNLCRTIEYCGDKVNLYKKRKINK